MHYSWLTASQSPFVLFVLLFLISHLLYTRYFRFIFPSVASGSILMGIGIVILVCLPIFIASPFISLLAALQLLILWLYIAERLLQAYMKEKITLESLTHRFEMGTWVAGTVVVVLFVDQVEPTLHGFIVLLGLIGIALYVLYVGVIARCFHDLISRRLHVPANGSVLLATVATQSIVLLLNEWFRQDMPLWAYQSLIGLGLLFYLLGVAWIIHHLCCARYTFFVATWPNANHIMYGALAITGFAALRVRAFSESIIAIMWWLAFLVFMVMLVFDGCRLRKRIHLKGFKKAVLVYSTSQWARVFTVGMFYAFTLTYYHDLRPPYALVGFIAHIGCYIVPLLLVIECLLALSFVVSVNHDSQETV